MRPGLVAAQKAVVPQNPDLPPLAVRHILGKSDVRVMCTDYLPCRCKINKTTEPRSAEAIHESEASATKRFQKLPCNRDHPEINPDQSSRFSSWNKACAEDDASRRL